jgi:hypothetical protein
VTEIVATRDQTGGSIGLFRKEAAKLMLRANADAIALADARVIQGCRSK